jgi:hypothetical protein
MQALAHILTAVEALGNTSPSFIYGAIAPDMSQVPQLHLDKCYRVTCSDTHDPAYLDKVIGRFADKDLALGFATHTYVVDILSHGDPSNFVDAKTYGPPDSKRGYALKWLDETLPGVEKKYWKRQYRAHFLPESMMEYHVIKHHPDVFKYVKKLKEVDVYAVSKDLANVFDKDVKFMTYMTDKWLSFSKWLTHVNRIFAPCSSDPKGEKEQFLNDCINGCKALKK